MSLEQTLFALIAGAVASVVVTLVGAWASSRFGLPGIARAVDTNHETLIKALQIRLDLAEEKASAAENTALETERRRRECEAEIRRVKRDLRDTEAELLDLYRSTGKRPPRRLQERVDET